MPGHKGRLVLPGGLNLFEADVTELPELDDLTYPASVLKQLEDRIASLYGVRESVISVNGASGALLASILAVAGRGSEILIPRNAHRSIVNALVLSGLSPRFYEPVWNEQWGVFESVQTNVLETAIKSGSGSSTLAGVVVCSPTFAGAVSDIRAIAPLVHKHDLPLIVDEAHGAHFLPGSTMPESACRNGADLVAHSFHKTLGALTQTGAVHVVSENFVKAVDVRAALRAVSTSSPSYVFLASIEQAIAVHESKEGIENLANVAKWAADARSRLSRKLRVYENSSGSISPLHILIGTARSGEQLQAYFVENGIFGEAVLGNGCLLMLGAGSVPEDLEALYAVVGSIPAEFQEGEPEKVHKPKLFSMAMSPRQAFFTPSRVVSVAEAEGRISADCLAPCPPGMPVCIPGSRIDKEVVELMRGAGTLRVLMEPE